MTLVVGMLDWWDVGISLVVVLSVVVSLCDGFGMESCCVCGWDKDVEDRTGIKEVVDYIVCIMDWIVC